MHIADRYDVIVVGARVAGAATALLLARAGARVLAVDRGTQGSDTLSTHALMRGAVVLLDRWGLLDSVIAAGTPAVRQATFFYGDEEVTVPIRPEHGVGALYAPRRTLLDPLLASAAEVAGADILWGWAVDELLQDGAGRTTGAVLRSREGRIPVRADLVIGADGRQSNVAQMVGAAVLHAGSAASSMVYAYFSGIEDRGYRWFFGGSAAAGAIPTNGGLHAVFAALPLARLRACCGGWGTLLVGAIAELNPAFGEALFGAQLMSQPVAFSGMPGLLRQATGPGWALVGDAGNYTDPVTVHGITDALRDATLLSAAVTAGTSAALREYGSIRDQLSLPFAHTTEAVAALDWSLDGAKQQHLELRLSMKNEVERLAASPFLDAA